MSSYALPNPFIAKAEAPPPAPPPPPTPAQRNLDGVLEALERELMARDNDPLPAFLDRGFLEKLNGTVERADPAHQVRGRRIVNLLKMKLRRPANYAEREKFMRLVQRGPARSRSRWNPRPRGQ